MRAAGNDNQQFEAVDIRSGVLRALSDLRQLTVGRRGVGHGGIGLCSCPVVASLAWLGMALHEEVKTYRGDIPTLSPVQKDRASCRRSTELLYSVGHCRIGHDDGEDVLYLVGGKSYLISCLNIDIQSGGLYMLSGALHTLLYRG